MLAQAPRPALSAPPPGEFRLVVDRVLTVPDVGIGGTVGAMGYAQGDLPVNSEVRVERGGHPMASCTVLMIKPKEKPLKTLDAAPHGEEVILLLSDVTAHDVQAGDVIARSSGQQ